MKKIRKLYQVMLCIGAAVILNIPAQAGEWKEDIVGKWYDNGDGSYKQSEWLQDNEKWYYFREDGYLLCNAWVGNYYVGADGAMLTGTITPDGYQVGEDGAWISKVMKYPVANYQSIILSDQVYQASLRGELSDIVDCGDYYEMKNQKLYMIKQYNTKKEAEAEKEYSSDYVYKLPNGKYVISAENDWMSHELVYSGSIYINKDVVFRYNIDKYTTFDDYMQRIEEIGISSGNGNRIGATIDAVDEKGYVTLLSFAILDYLP